MLAGGVALGGLLLTSCALPGTSAPVANLGTVHIAGAPVVVPAPTIVVSPGDSAQGVALDAPVVVNVATGHLDTVSLSQAGSSTVYTGALSAEFGTLWEMSAPLAPDAHYTVVATATSAAGNTSTSTTTFVTVAATSRLLTGMTPLNGEEVGVGETIDLASTPQSPPMCAPRCSSAFT